MLQVNSLSVSFSAAHSVQVVQNVSLKIKAGKKVAIIGETGSGKSVLLLAILQLLPHTAQVRGEVSYKGKDLLQMKEREIQAIRGAQIAYVPQGSGNSLNPLIKVGAQVGEPLVQHHGYKKAQAMEESVKLLQRFQIERAEKRAKYHPHTFSGGMKQRALVAMGIAAGAKIILADEPTKGLDELRIQQVKEAFLSLEQQAILCVTHDLNFAKEIAQDIHVMYASQQVECAPREILLKQPLHPYTRDMIAAMPENGLKAGKGFAPSNTQSVSTCRYRDRCGEACSQCDNPPPLVKVDTDHEVRCWKYAS